MIVRNNGDGMSVGDTLGIGIVFCTLGDGTTLCCTIGGIKVFCGTLGNTGAGDTTGLLYSDPAGGGVVACTLGNGTN